MTTLCLYPSQNKEAYSKSILLDRIESHLRSFLPAKELKRKTHLMKFLKSHYEYIIVGCCFLLLFINVGLASSSFNVYQPYLAEIPGIGHAGAGAILTVRTFTSFICMFLVMYYYRFIPVRSGILIASLLTATGFLVFSFADSMMGFCLGAILTGMGYGLGGMVASTLVIGNWFYGHVGTAAGIAAVGSGVASMVMPVILAPLIENVGLHQAFIAESVLAAVLALVVFCLLRAKPSDVGLVPVEAKARPTKKTQATFSTKALPRSYQMLMEIAMVCLGAVAVVGMNYLSILFTSDGISTMLAATFISLTGMFLTIGKLVVGIAFDRFGTIKGSTVFFGFMIVGLILCCAASLGNPVEAALAACIYGAGTALGSTGISVWSLELSPAQQSLKLIRNFQLAYAFGGFIFNLMPGTIVHFGGTYTTSYVVLTLLALICATIVLSVYKKVAR